MGFKGELENFADSMLGRVKQSGAKTVVTCCSDCYSGFRQIYPLAGKGFNGVEVVHITEMVDRLIREGTVRLTEKVPMRVVYHDPCHLGRLGELHTPWSGTREFQKVPGTYIHPHPLILASRPPPCIIHLHES
jgi:Fe-S oxidoreductase